MEEYKKTKQVIVMRTDLNMRKGKMISQGSHASMMAVLGLMTNTNLENSHVVTIPMTKDARPHYLFEHTPLYHWLLDGRYTKVCVGVNSLDELTAVYEKAKIAGIPCSLITDAGLTEFKGVPTVTCCAVGPAYLEDVDPITGHLKLL